MQVVVLTCSVIILQTRSVTEGDSSCNLQLEKPLRLGLGLGLELSDFRQDKMPSRQFGH